MISGMLSVDEALVHMLGAAAQVTETESLATLSAAGRVLARTQVAAMNVPPMDNSAMDGYALRIADLSPGKRLKVTQKIMAGSVGHALKPGTAARIFTGSPVPPGADAVVMQELCVQQDDQLAVNMAPGAGDWIRRTGSDIGAGQDILTAGSRLRPQDTGLAASVGIATLPVYRRVRLGLFFTGDELVMPGDPLAPGRIYNSNRFTLNGLAAALGCDVRDYGIVPDSLQATRGVLRHAAEECDIIVTSGGVSVGDADFVRPAVEAEGELLMWRIAMKPGRPLAFGRVRRNSASAGTASFIGLPGNPVSSFVTFLMFVRPFVLRTQGIARVHPQGLPARADFDWAVPDKRREFLRARWNDHDGLALYPSQDSAVLTSTTWADGLIDNPAGQVIKAGDAVRFLPFSELLS